MGLKSFLRVQKEPLPFNQMLSVPDSQLNWNYFHRNLCPQMHKMEYTAQKYIFH
jgi:hypothetical protein